MFNTKTSLEKKSFNKLQKEKEILKKYWGFDSFREKQDEIISSILAGNDTLALLPTGGGKSICYQVPAMVMDGVCLVISPLIALMEDQVSQLKKKGIAAIAINSGMTNREIDIALDNAIYGQTKFLYVSPERLQTRIFKARFAKMNINLIAVDEAHCISEWGYDFRPNYLTIADLRKQQPKVAFLALTATATANVVVDIQDKLEFSKQCVISKSFERKNISYNTYVTNNKLNRIERFIKNNTHSGIIYCATRRHVKELFIYLHAQGYSVAYYHGGLDFEERRVRQKKWMQNEVKVIIATNAFGMGIDKPDVRFVLHYDIPTSLEAYFQEAGRGGRDEKKAIANLYYNAEDVLNLRKKLELNYPPIETIKRIYNALGNHFQLAFGSGKECTFPIDLAEFADKYNQNLMVVYSSLKFLELCGFIVLSDSYKQSSTLKINGDNKDLYAYQVRDAKLNKIIQFILRTEIGAFDNYVKVNEFQIAKKTGLPTKVITEKLAFLTAAGVIDFIPRKNSPSVTYLMERLSDTNISISPTFYHNRKLIAEKKMDAMVHFLNSKTCNSELLLHYFGEKNTKPCGICSSCVETKFIHDSILIEIRLKAKEIAQKETKITLLSLFANLAQFSEKEILQNIRTMVDLNEIKMDAFGKSFVFKT